MNRNEILATIRNLANIQGFYGRLFNTIMRMRENNPRNYELLMRGLEARNFEDATELTLFIECELVRG